MDASVGKLRLECLGVTISCVQISTFGRERETGANERRIGELTAVAACALSEALRELHNGGLTVATRAAGGALIGELYALRQDTLGPLDFDLTARVYGRLMLRACCDPFGKHPSETTIETVIDAVLDLLNKVVRARINPSPLPRGPVGKNRCCIGLGY